MSVICRRRSLQTHQWAVLPGTGGQRSKLGGMYSPLSTWKPYLHRVPHLKDRDGLIHPSPSHPCQLQLPTANLLSPELLANQLQLKCSNGPSSLGSLYSLEWPAERRETFYVLDR